MKLYNIFCALGLAALTLTACTDDQNYDDTKHPINTAAGVTVCLPDEVVSVKENAGISTIPVEVKGDANGYIEVTVKVTDGTVTDDEQEPAIADQHYAITSTTIYIPADSKQGNIQFVPKNFKLPQKTRTFNVTIVSVKGATVAGNNDTEVAILDRGSSPAWSEFNSDWFVSGYEYNSKTGEYDTPFSYRGTFRMVDDKNMEFAIPGFDGYAFMALPFRYDYEMLTPSIGYGDVEAVLGGSVATNVNFGDPIGVANLVLTSGQGAATGTVAGSWNESFTSVSFGDAEFVVSIFDLNGGNTGYYYSRFSNLSITRIPGN